MRLIVFISLFMIGCANKGQECGGKVLVLWPTGEPGKFEFQERKLETIDSLNSLSGRAAKVYFESGIGTNGFEGSVAEPRLTKSGDTCVPMDVGSSMAIATYAQFEELYKFERRLGIGGMLSWPRQVGVDIHMRVNRQSTHNNAHYFSSGDAIAVLPFQGGGKVPMGLNHGVIAHEHFHAHFQRQVNNPMNSFLEKSGWRESVSIKPAEDLENVDIGTPRGINNFILRGWNEGLADLYAGIYTGNSRFLLDSTDRFEWRDLNGPLEPFETVGDVIAFARGLRASEELTGYSYVEGSKLARLLYRLAKADERGPEAFLVALMRRLERLPALISAVYLHEVMTFDTLLPVLLQGSDLNLESCLALSDVITKPTYLEGFPQCPNL